MEYCENIIGSYVNRKKIKRMLGAATAMAFIAGTAYEMPSWDWGAVYKGGKPFDKDCYTEKEAMPTRGNTNVLETNVTLLESIGKFDIPVRTLQESIADYRRQCSDIIPNTAPQGRHIDLLDRLFQAEETDRMDMEENLSADNIRADFPMDYDILSPTNKNSISEITPDNMNPGIPADNMIPVVPAEENVPDTQGGDIPAESIVPDIPEDAIVPDVPDQNVIPDIPHEEPVPDISGEDTQPDIPEEGVEPDMPSDGDIGSADVTMGFKVNSDGMIYSFIPDEAVVEDGGYLLLPSEGCSGILTGAFTGAGAGIYDIFIPSNITYIEENAFRGMDELYGIDVEDNHPNYSSEGGVMFDKDRSVLLVFPEARIGTFAVPQGVTKFADYSFADTNLEKLDMRACGLIEVGDFLFGESDGNGIVIMAPKDYFTEFQEIFEGYNVIVQ